MLLSDLLLALGFFLLLLGHLTEVFPPHGAELVEHLFELGMASVPLHDSLGVGLELLQDFVHLGVCEGRHQLRRLLDLLEQLRIDPLILRRLEFALHGVLDLIDL